MRTLKNFLVYIFLIRVHVPRLDPKFGLSTTNRTVFAISALMGLALYHYWNVKELWFHNTYIKFHNRFNSEWYHCVVGKNLKCRGFCQNSPYTSFVNTDKQGVVRPKWKTPSSSNVSPATQRWVSRNSERKLSSATMSCIKGRSWARGPRFPARNQHQQLGAIPKVPSQMARLLGAQWPRLQLRV